MWWLGLEALGLTQRYSMILAVSLLPLLRSYRWKEGVAVHPADPVRECYSYPTSEGTYYWADFRPCSAPALCASNQQAIEWVSACRLLSELVLAWLNNQTIAYRPEAIHEALRVWVGSVPFIRAPSYPFNCRIHSEQPFIRYSRTARWFKQGSVHPSHKT